MDTTAASKVVQLRYWQHLLNEMLKRRMFKIPIHLAFGHEAVAVALDSIIDRSDALCLSHRNVTHNIAQAGSLDAVLSHYRLEPEPDRRSQMGSMNLAVDNSVIRYSSSVLGNNLPVAAGIAMNRIVTGRPGVSYVFTGDGAMEEGAFWETLVFARSHKLRLVVVVENNNYSMSSTIPQRRSAIDLQAVCAGVGVQYLHARGAFLRETSSTLAAARTAARSGAPACVELELSTFNQHAGPTPGWPDDPLRIALEDGLIIKHGIEDPVFNTMQELGSQAFEQICNKVMSADASEKYLH